MVERSQSLLQYYNSTATLQRWCSTDHGSHTPTQEDVGHLFNRAGAVCVEQKTETDICRNWL